MDDKQLQRAIRSIGMGCFVKYYESFRDLTQSNEKLVELLMSKERYAEIASHTRVICSRRIIQSGRGPDILAEIIQSERLDYEVIAKAKELLRKYPS